MHKMIMALSLIFSINNIFSSEQKPKIGLEASFVVGSVMGVTPGVNLLVLSYKASGKLLGSNSAIWYDKETGKHYSLSDHGEKCCKYFNAGFYSGLISCAFLLKKFIKK